MTPPSEPRAADVERQVPSAALFQGRREIVIVTRADKLILTK